MIQAYNVQLWKMEINKKRKSKGSSMEEAMLEITIRDKKRTKCISLSIPKCLIL